MADCFPDKHLQMSLYEIFSIDLKPIEPASYVLFVCLFVMDPGAFWLNVSKDIVKIVHVTSVVQL